MSRLLVVGAILLGLTGCTRVHQIRGQLEGIEALTDQADRNGAKRCAPKELALARAHAEFTAVELDQGNWVRADKHLEIAVANARAAYDLAPASFCSERRFAEAPPPDKPPPPPVEKPPPPPAPGDADGDGFLDPDDKCKTDPENYQGYQDHDGCPDDADTDGDGILDSVDGCELLAEDKDGYLDQDGCPDPDNDLDGILDVDETAECRDKPEDPDGYQDTDGCPDPDNDADKVVDLEDQCPLEPGVVGGKRPGCPKKPSLVVVTAKEIKITQQIHFALNKATIRPISYKVLDAVVDVMKNNPKIRIEVQGHTDNLGGRYYNKTLSQNRANSVRRYLINHGIDATRLVAKGFGFDQPIVPNTSARNRALNRRVQFVRIEKKKP